MLLKLALSLLLVVLLLLYQLLLLGSLVVLILVVEVDVVLVVVVVCVFVLVLLLFVLGSSSNCTLALAVALLVLLLVHARVEQCIRSGCSVGVVALPPFKSALVPFSLQSILNRSIDFHFLLLLLPLPLSLLLFCLFVLLVLPLLSLNRLPIFPIQGSILELMLVLPASETLRVQSGCAGETLNLLRLVVHLSRSQLAALSDLLHFLLSQAERNILWLEVSVYDLADAVEVV